MMKQQIKQVTVQDNPKYDPSALTRPLAMFDEVGTPISFSTERARNASQYAPKGTLVTANTGTSYTMSTVADNTYYALTATANAVVLSIAAASARTRIRVKLSQDATGGRKITYPSNLVFPGNAEPNLGLTANSWVEWEMVTLDGTTWTAMTQNGGPLNGKDPLKTPNLTYAWEPYKLNALADAAALSTNWIDSIAAQVAVPSASVTVNTRKVPRGGALQRRVIDVRTAAQQITTPTIAALAPATGWTCVFGWNPVTWGNAGSYLISAANFLVLGIAGTSPNGVLYAAGAGGFSNGTNITVVAAPGIIPVSVQCMGAGQPMRVYWDDTLVTWDTPANLTQAANQNVVTINPAGGSGGQGTGDLSCFFLASSILPDQDVAALRAWVRDESGR